MAGIPTDVNTYTFQWGKMLRVTPEQQQTTAFARALGDLLESGWSQRGIARAMGLSHPQVRDYLDGKQEPGFFKVVALANEAGVSLDWLAGREAYLPRVVVNDVRYVPEQPALARDAERAVEGLASLDDRREEARKQTPASRRGHPRA